jgi:hypothetical protein
MTTSRLIAPLRASLALAALLLAGAVTAPAARSQTLGIGTSPQGTLVYALGAAYARVLGEREKIPALVQPQGGTGVLIPLVDRGELDMGFANTLEVAEAYAGTGSFKDRPQKNLRVAGLLMAIKVGLFVRKDSPIRTLADLKGRSIAYGYVSQEILRTVLDGMLANAGLAIGDLKPVLVPNLIRGVDEFITGKIDVGFFALGQAKVTEADSAVGGIRFLPMNEEPRRVEAMTKLVPSSYLARVEPAPGLAGVAAPLVTMHYDYVMFVNAKLPPERVQQMTRALALGRDELAASARAFAEMEPRRLWRRYTVPYHDGALAYFKDAGIALAGN